MPAVPGRFGRKDKGRRGERSYKIMDKSYKILACQIASSGLRSAAASFLKAAGVIPVTCLNWALR